MKFNRSTAEMSAHSEYETLVKFIEDRISQGNSLGLVLNETKSDGTRVSNVIVNVVKPSATELEDNGAFEHNMSQIPGFLCVYTDSEHYQYIKEDNIIRVLVN